MGFDGQGKIYIPLEAWCEFVSGYAPSAKSGAEFSYAPPRIEGEELVVDYAFSTDCHPSSWTLQPYWLKKPSA